MDSATYTVNIPNSDLKFFKEIAKRFGWNAHKQKSTKKSQLEKAFEEVEQGKLIDAKDAADVMKICLG